jgi:hypothetical protein
MRTTTKPIRLLAEILGLGLSHYPPLSTPDAMMSGILRTTLKDSNFFLNTKFNTLIVGGFKM